MAKETETAGVAGAVAAPAKSGTGTARAMSIEERLAKSGQPPEQAGTPPEPEQTTPPAGEQPEAEQEEATPTDQEPGEAEAEGEVQEGEIKEGEIDGLSEKAQAKVNKRIHEINIKYKNEAERAQDLESRLEGVEKKLSSESIKSAVRLGIDPNYIEEDGAKLLQEFDNLKAWKRFCTLNRDEDYEGTGTPEKPQYTRAQIRELEAGIDDRLLDVAGPARQTWSEARKQQLADQEAGRKLRLAKAKPSNARPDPNPPKLPTRKGASSVPPVGTQGRRRAGFDQGQFKTEGADRNSLNKQFEKMFGG
ncbi:MAG: hypothetical protein WC551_12570 [Patescibacteria group bacterium]